MNWLTMTILISGLAGGFGTTVVAKEVVRAKKKAPAKSSSLKRKPDSDSCQPELWPNKRDFALREAVNLFESVSRENLVRMVWSELVIPSEQPLYPIMLLYLAETEPDKLKRGYFKGILIMSNADLSLQKVKDEWPFSVKPERKWSVQELCKLWLKSSKKN